MSEYYTVADATSVLELLTDFVVEHKITNEETLHHAVSKESLVLLMLDFLTIVGFYPEEANITQEENNE